MRPIKTFIFIVFTFFFISCESIVKDINIDPNEPASTKPELLIKGVLLANITVQVSHLQRISGMWTGQYKGLVTLYTNLFNYNISTAESNDTWSYIYQGIIKQNKVIHEQLATYLPSNSVKLIKGITKIIEANAVGSAAAIFGDIPYSEASNAERKDPVFDTQKEVYNSMQIVLDDAIKELESITATITTLNEDILLNGDHKKWMKIAHTLKSRYFMETKEYEKAYESALKGIDTPEGSLYFKPPAGGTVVNGNRNLLNTFISARGGYMSSKNTFFDNLLQGSQTSRNNAKTNETDRASYYLFNEDGASSQKGVAAPEAPMPLVIYEENLLNLAEAGMRTKGFTFGLDNLNKLRKYLSSNATLFAGTDTKNHKYEEYVEADFQAKGIENTNSIDINKALLREIIEERYVTLVGQFIPFNDARRLRKSDSDISIYQTIPFNTTVATQYPERIPYSQNEINANENIDSDPGIYQKTEVNQ